MLAAAYLYLIRTNSPEAPLPSALIQHGIVQIDSLRRSYRAYGLAS